MSEGIGKNVKIAMFVVAIIPFIVFLFTRDNSLKTVQKTILEGETYTIQEIFEKSKAVKNVQWGFEKIEMVEALERNHLDTPTHSYGRDYYYPEEEYDREYQYLLENDEYVTLRFNMCTKDRGVSRIQKIYFDVVDGKAFIVKMASYYDKILITGELQYSRQDINPKNTYNYFIKEFAMPGSSDGDLELIDCSEIDEEEVKENLAKRKKEVKRKWKEERKKVREDHALKYRQKEMKKRFGHLIKK